MKHAILILGHNNFSVLSMLIKQFDHPSFDIYVHINKKVKNFPKAEWENSIKQASLHFVKRRKVGYCDYSMVRAVMQLFKEATASYHDYYHLISGADLMIKKHDEFFAFFEKNAGKEFVAFWDKFDLERVQYRNYFVAWCRQKSHFRSVLFIKIRYFLIRLQKLLGLRCKNIKGYRTMHGPDWYSITHNAACHLIKEEPLFKKGFYRAYCPTEFFPQTILWNSEFKGNLYKNDIRNTNEQNVREIDWVRGRPYTYTKEDKELLLNSKCLFARKFDETIDRQIAQEIFAYTSEEDKEDKR